MNNHILVVTLRGEGVWHNCQIQFAIKDTTDATLEKVSKKLAAETNLKIYDFKYNDRFGTVEAATSNKDVRVYIEDVEIF